MVFVYPICGNCGLNQWRTVEGHIKKCVAAQPNVPDRDIKPGEPHWSKSDPPLKNHTRAAETEAMYTLQVWPDPPNNEATHQGQIIECIQKEWTAKVSNTREAATVEAAKANKDDDGEVNKGDNKQAKLRPK